MKTKKQKPATQQSPADVPKRFTFPVTVNIAGHEFTHDFKLVQFRSHGARATESQKWVDTIFAQGTDGRLRLTFANEAARMAMFRALITGDVKALRCDGQVASIELELYARGWPNESPQRFFAEQYQTPPVHSARASITPAASPGELVFLASHAHQAQTIAVMNQNDIKAIEVDSANVRLFETESTMVPMVTVITKSDDAAQRLAVDLRSKSVTTIGVSEDCALSFTATQRTGRARVYVEGAPDSALAKELEKKRVLIFHPDGTLWSHIPCFCSS